MDALYFQDVDNQHKNLPSHKLAQHSMNVVVPPKEGNDTRLNYPILYFKLIVFYYLLSKYYDENKTRKRRQLDSLQQSQAIALVAGDRVMQALSFNVQHLSPQRNSQTRLYINENRSQDVYRLISNKTEKVIKRHKKSQGFLIHWMRVFGIGISYRIRPFEGLASVIEVKENASEDFINLVDKGFGAGQVFVILLQIAYSAASGSNKKNLLLIEEPEANLHPKYQSQLAEMFLEANQKFGVHFILETHSEYMLRKSQILVKESNEKEEYITNLRFAVFYFDEKEGAKPIRYRDDGKFIDEFGSGFFDESSRLAFEVL